MFEFFPFQSQFIHLGQTLKYYGYIKFDPCVTDFPEKGCQVIVSAGNNELNFHVKLPSEQMKEGSFKVTRMRCWRVTSSVSGFASWRRAGDENGIATRNKTAAPRARRSLFALKVLTCALSVSIAPISWSAGPR